MKKVININFQGSIVPIEESAFDILQKYISTLRAHFANEEGRDEIINDIELRIAELFNERLSQGKNCIEDDDVNQIISSIGRPEDFDIENDPENEKTNNQEQAFATQGSKRLYRDENNKVLGGVCSGIANYFNIDPVIVRIIAIVCISLVLIPYIILWIAVPGSTTQVIGSPRKRLFRDTDSKILGGVCSGLATYFGTSPWIPRVIFLIPFISLSFGWSRMGFFHFPHVFSLTFSPAFTIAYIILWALVPEAKTAAEKLEMQGKPVDLNSIKETIQNDLGGFKDRTQKWSNDFSNSFKSNPTATSDTAEASPEAETPTGNQQPFVSPALSPKKRTSLGDVLILLVKIFAYTILGILVATVLVALFALGIATMGLLPIKGFFINDGWETVLLWITFFLFIWVPIIGIFVWLFRKISRRKGNSGMVRGSFIGLWTLGWISLFWLIALFGHDNGKRGKTDPTDLKLIQPGNKTLVIASDNVQLDNSDFDLFDATFDLDTFRIGNTRITLEQSKDDSFHISAMRSSSGENESFARNLAYKIPVGLRQVDSTIFLLNGITINKQDKFHNQQIVYTVYVPIGKKILIKESNSYKNLAINSFGIRMNDNYYNNNWNYDREYIMTNEGLQPVTPDPRDNTNDDDTDLDELRNSYKEDSLSLIQKRQEMQQKIEQQKQDLERQRKELDQKSKELEEAPASKGTTKVNASVEMPLSLASVIKAKLFL